jgi:ketosteroid isomerase-like protein
MSSDQQEGNPIVRMFAWWNEAYRDHAFTPEGFARFFTKDAPFMVNGGLRGAGPAEICAHFQAIRAATDRVELVLSVRESLASPSLAFVHYQVKAESAGKAEGEDCLAVAHLRDGLIASFEVIGRAT